MTNYLKVNMKDKKLVMDRTFAKNASLVGSREYKLLQEARRDYEPIGFTVEVKTIKRNSAKECYKGLNYEFMEDYIRTHETKETVVEVLSEFEEMLLISQCHSKAFRYPTIKKWFLEKYPEIVQFGMPKEETKTKEEVITTLPKAS